MNKQALSGYFEQVESFDRSRLRSTQRWVGVAWTVALIAGGVAGLEGFAVANLALQPRPDPVVLRVDNATGLVDRVYDVDGGRMEASEAEARHWLWQFVRAAESYSYAEAAPNLQTVALMAVPSVQKDQAARVAGSNPLSPQVVLGRTGQRVLNWESTAIIAPGLAQVRFTETDRKNDNLLPLRHMLATVAYGFAKGPLSGAALNVNPRGFMVSSYQVEQEGAQ